MPRTGENIYKRKDGRWEGRYIKERVEGKAKYRAVYAKTYREVRKKLEEAKRALEKKDTETANAGKVADIGNQWLSEAALSLKQSSINKYEDILRRYILPEFGEAELSTITNQRLINFANGLLLNGGAKKQGLTPVTVSEILSVMNGIRIYAAKRDYAMAFSTECVNLKKEPKEIRVFSLEEENMLIGYLQEHINFRPLVFCSAFSREFVWENSAP